jgi:hypothetical protein
MAHQEVFLVPAVGTQMSVLPWLALSQATGEALWEARAQPARRALVPYRYLDAC